MPSFKFNHQHRTPSNWNAPLALTNGAALLQHREAPPRPTPFGFFARATGDATTDAQPAIGTLLWRPDIPGKLFRHPARACLPC
jgi:hypothetical protein